ncbi:MAG: cytochrome c peroxidase [Planctomycetota bacterium]
MWTARASVSTSFADSNQTQQGTVLGTPFYMAPEQASGESEAVGPETDVYSLGSILFALLTQRTPFVSKNVVQLLEEVRSKQPPSPRSFNNRVHADLETIVLKCLEKPPSKRYASASDLADDLRRFLDGEPITAKPITTAERVHRWVRKRSKTVALASALLLAILTTAFLAAELGRRSKTERLLASRAPVVVKTPLGLPTFSVPSDNPLTQGKVALGKQLFFDKRLSVDDSVSCASCHDPSLGWSDGRVVSMGVGGQPSSRNSPGIFNGAFGHFFFWDGRSNSLEEQSVQPITNSQEMGFTSLTQAAAKLNEIEGYRDQFSLVFDDGVTAQNLKSAITAFERTLVAGNSPFDRYNAGDKTSMSESAIRGMKVFFHEGHCSACHSGPLLSDGGFHNLGVGMRGPSVDPGRISVTNRRGDRGSFKTPSLRDVSRTAPYMHDGSLRSLEDVIDFYDRGGVQNPQLDEEIYALELTDQQKRDLAQFLQEGLTSSSYPMMAPPTLPR